MARPHDTLSLPKLRHARQEAAEEKYEWLAGQNRIECGDLTEALRGEFGSAMGERYGRLIVERDLWEEALRLAFHKDGRVAFRASWALEWAYFNHRGDFAAFIPSFFDNYLKTENPSVHRHYAKMLCDMMRRGIFVPDSAQTEQIAEKTFDLLIGEDTKSAVRVWAAEVLFELSPRLDWIGEHLEEVLRRQMETMPTPAIINHYGKLLRRIAKRK